MNYLNYNKAQFDNMSKEELIMLVWDLSNKNEMLKLQIDKCQEQIDCLEAKFDRLPSNTKAILTLTSGRRGR